MAEEIQGTAPAEGASASEGAFDAGIDSAESSAGLESTDDIVAALERMDGEDGDAPEAKEGDGEPAEVAEQPEQSAPEIPVPEGWDEGMWSGLSPEVREHVNARVQAHAQALAAEKAAQQALVQRQNEYAVQTNAQLQQALAVMKQVCEREYGTLDWQSLAQTDPASYVRFQQEYAQRMGAIQQIQQGITAQAEQIRQARAAEARRHLDSEYETVLPEVRALMGAGFDGPRFAGEVAQYLVSQGVPKDAVNGIENGYELKLAVKAMLYDRQQKARSTAAAKVAEAPKVAAPNGGAVNDNGGAGMAKAMRGLRANPNSTEALAAVLGLL